VFVIRETFRYLKHAWASWLMQVLTLGVALGVSALFVLLAWKAHDAMSSLRANLAIEAFFDPDVSSQNTSTIADQSIKSIPGISHIIFISKEQALEDYAKMSGEDIQQVLGVNPLPASVKIFLTEPTARAAAQLETLLRRVPNIQDVKSNAPLIGIMESRSHALDRIAILLCSLLLLSAIFHAHTSARRGFEIRRETTRTLTRMGATRFMIFAPMLLYNALAGICGGIVGTGILLLIHTQILMAMSDVFALTLASRDEIIVCGVLMLSGFVISALAASLNGRMRA
jgi:cell division transport system permease protein